MSEIDEIDSAGLFSRFKTSTTDDIVNKEKKRNPVDEAHDNEQVGKSNNRFKIGQFGVDWLVWTTSIVTGVFILMFMKYACNISQSPDDLAMFLDNCYKEINAFVTSHQSMIAVIATLIFGDKIKSKVSTPPSK